jgi:rRNA maturation endonuclease Nob1
MAKKTGKTKDSEKARSRIGEVRCLNCFERYRVPPKAEKFTCPSCGWEWRVSWVNPKLAKIRGPMWDRIRY